jgi:nucleotide-binding universal stress UspA family protein
MAYVPDHQHDVFVSYAHVDDLPLPGAEQGWVTTLIESLQILLAQKLGRRDAFSLWMDHQLSRHAQLTPEILDNLGKTATLLVVLSPGYLASEWCLREKDSFLARLEGRVRSGSRIFIVERDKVDFEERPPQFSDLLGYRFWVQEGQGNPPRILGSPWPDPKNPQNMPYFDELTRLAANIAEELKKLRRESEAVGAAPATAATPAQGSAAAAEASAPAEAAAPDRPAVFLAEVTDDLDAESDSLRRTFEQAGLAVLPTTWYPREPEAYRQALDVDLAKAKVFVQLLSELPGKRPPGLPQGYVRLQHERAVAAGLPVVQWHRRDLDPAAVADPEHRAFLQGETVMVVGLEELKREAIERAQAAPKPASPAPPTDALVFVDAEAGDAELATAAADLLAAHGLSCVLPLRSGSPAEVREDLEQNLMFCDALVVVWGTIGARWVRDQLLVWRKVGWKRERPLKFLALLEGPPADKEPLGLSVPNLDVLDGRGGVDERTLAPLLAALAEVPGG